MADNTKIEWARHPQTGRGASWNPVRARNRATGKVGWHCTHVSPGCVNCYSESFNARLGTGLAFKPGHEADIEVFLDEDMLRQPLRWKAPRGIFVCSMTDLFGDFVTDEMLDRTFAVMALAPQHTFQVLTKRSARMRAYCSNPMTRERIDQVMDAIAPAHWHRRELEDFGGWPLPNAWLGVSAEDQTRADERVPDLLATPAAVRWISYEPALEPIELDQRWLDGTSLHCERGHIFPMIALDKLSYRQSPSEAFVTPICGECGGDAKAGMAPRISWVVAGGESGPHARPAHPDWFRSVRDQCAAAGVPYFHKQNGEFLCGEIVDDVRFVGGARLQTESGAYAIDGSTRIVRLDSRIGAIRVGKRDAGRLLDGREHNDMPPMPPIGA